MGGVRGPSGVAATEERGGLRRGYTTGACAQAATVAALLRNGTGGGEVEVTLPGGERAAFAFAKDDDGTAWVIKDAGDDPDVTNGLAIGARVRPTPGRFAIEAGEGVGTVTAPGLSVEPGEPAINPVPRDAILAELERGAPEGATVEILAPGGEKLAKKTLNPRLGITGGISILGTTGRVEPWSVEAMRESLVPQLDVALARSRRELVFVLGAKGRRLAEEAGFAAEDVIETGNELGWMLGQAAERGFSRVTVRGHVGKLAKLAAGIFDTHSREADARLVTLAAYAGATGVPAEDIRRLLAMATAEEGAGFLLDLGAGEALTEVARASAERASGRYELAVRIVMLDRAGRVLADSESGEGAAR